MMIKLASIFLVVFTACSCRTTEPKTPDPVSPAPVEQPVEAAEPYQIMANGKIQIRFDLRHVPYATETVEIIYDQAYLGYFLIGDSVTVPAKSGRVPLIATFSNRNGVIETKTYHISFTNKSEIKL